MDKIKYDDKVAIQNDESVPNENKVTADDMNEIKKVVNNNADEFEKETGCKINIDMSEGNEYYLLVFQLLNSQNENLSSVRIDLPIGDFVVNGEYKNGNIILTTKKRTEIKIPIVGVENGLVDKATFNKSISALNEGQAIQNIEIEAIKAEDKRLREDMNNTIPSIPGSGEEINLKETSNARFKRFEIGGNSYQETRKGYNVADIIPNLIKAPKNGLTVRGDDKEGYIIVNGTANSGYISLTENININDVLEDGQIYTVWQENIVETPNTGIYLQVSITKKDNNGKTYISSASSLGNYRSFTVDKTNNSYNLNIQTGGSLETFENYKNRFMLVKGVYDTKTIPKFEVYGATPSLEYKSEVKACGDNSNINFEINNDNTEKQNISIPTQKPMLDGDYFDRKNYKEVHGWLKVVLDGTNNIVYQTSTSENEKHRYSFNIKSNYNKIPKNCDLTSNKAYCDSLKLLNAGQTYNLINGFTIFDNYIWIYTDGRTAEAMNNYLKENPMTFYIPLEEPELIECTEEQSRILDEIENTLHSYKGTTHILSTDEVSPIFDVEALVDIESYIESKLTATSVSNEPIMEQPSVSPKMEETEIGGVE